MKRTLSIVLCALCITLCISFTSAAASSHVSDGANLLYDYEITVLDNALQELGDGCGADLVVVTVESLGGRTAAAFADDYYDNNGYGENGILLLVAMQEREWFISTAGNCISAVNADGLRYLENSFSDYLSRGAYYDAFRSFADAASELIVLAAEGEPYNAPIDVSAISTYLIVSLGIGLVVALIATGVMKGKLRSIHPQQGADNYVRDGSLNITNAADLYLYSHVSRVAKPKESKSGGSSVRVSSSGRSHGGGGGKF